MDNLQLKRIVIEWLGYSGLTTVEWIFASQKDGATLIGITEASIGSSGFQVSINDRLIARTSRDVPSQVNAHVSHPSLKEESARRRRR
jgi:hypothetical protein